MELPTGEEHEELRRTVRSFLERSSPEDEVRRLMETDLGHDPAVWRRMAGELGLTGLGVPEEYGGAGGGPQEIGIVLEEMGRALMCTPYFSTVVLAAGALLHSGDESARKEYLPGIAAGETIATLALAEETAHWDPAGIATTARRVGTSWELTGTKLFVLDGMAADLVLVAARTGPGDDDIGLFAVDGAAPRRTAMPTLDPTRRQARLDLEATPGRLVGPERGARPVLRRVLDLAAVALACEQVGGAQRALDMAVEYARTRIQFGRPIGSFQAVKHRCADMALGIDAARSAMGHGVWAAVAAPDELPVAASMARVCCSEAYVFAASENIQVHGGIGFTWEHSAHLHFRRAKTGAVLFGDPACHRERLVRLLLDEAGDETGEAGEGAPRVPTETT